MRYILSLILIIGLSILCFCFGDEPDTHISGSIETSSANINMEALEDAAATYIDVDALFEMVDGSDSITTITTADTFNFGFVLEVQNPGDYLEADKYDIILTDQQGKEHVFKWVRGEPIKIRFEAKE